MFLEIMSKKKIFVECRYLIILVRVNLLYWEEMIIDSNSFKV